MSTNLIDFIRPEPKLLKFFTDGLRDGVIIIDNSFQRKFVWTLKDQVSLIETILMGFPIPELYLWQNDTNAETGETIWSVVDGQQRITSIKKFISNEFHLEKRFIENKKASYAGKNFSELDDDQKRQIWKYSFAVRFIQEDVSKDQIIKIFLRLNRTGVSLNPQELRNAEFNGKFNELAGQLADLDFWEKYSIFSHSELRRMVDVQFVSTLLIFLRSGIEEETSQSAINRVYDQYNESYPEAKNDKLTVTKILSIIEKIAKDKPYITDALKIKSHLYTLFNLGYYLLATRVRAYGEIAEKLDLWFHHYENSTNFKIKEQKLLMDKYRGLMKEGVQKKTNRQHRFEILRDYLGLD